MRAGRDEALDDDWGGTTASIVLSAASPAESLDGLTDFSHAEVLFFFDRVAPDTVVNGARHPRGNKTRPAGGIFAQRGKARPNRIGSMSCRIVGREGRELEVAELDAIDGTPVSDLKPVMKEFLPRGKLRQPAWPAELMRDYWRTLD